MNAVIELEEAYLHYKDDPEFNRELTELFNEYAGRPSRLYYASHMTEDLGGASAYAGDRGAALLCGEPSGTAEFYTAPGTDEPRHFSDGLCVFEKGCLL